MFLYFYLLFFRLKEINMSEYDAATYERFSNAVQRQVQSLRVILESLQVNTLCQSFIVFSNACVLQSKLINK